MPLRNLFAPDGQGDSKLEVSANASQTHRKYDIPWTIDRHTDSRKPRYLRAGMDRLDREKLSGWVAIAVSVGVFWKTEPEPSFLDRHREGIVISETN